MMERSLVLEIHFHDGRYHGTGDVAPSPARLFQALMAGAGLGGPLDPDARQALEWLEKLSPPLIAFPAMLNGQSLKISVPNNDLDSVRGERTWKQFAPRLFDCNIPFLYLWNITGDDQDARHAEKVCKLADGLYQFGRGIDFAWASGEVLDGDTAKSRLSSYPGVIFHPCMSSVGQTLPCPKPGSLRSLMARYSAGGARFRIVRREQSTIQHFYQQPKAQFAPVPYNSPPSRVIYELHSEKVASGMVGWPLASVSKLVTWLRDGAVARLKGALPPERQPDIRRFLVGRKRNGDDGGPHSLRVRIIPLPSIGHIHADRSIRRLLVEVPSGCPLRADDVRWAFSGLNPIDATTGESIDLILIPSADETMLGHYGINADFRMWRTVTPIALPERELHGIRSDSSVGAGAGRATKYSSTAVALVRALRHAGVQANPETIRLQREPLETNGEHSETFAVGTRFPKKRLWHAEISFDSRIRGPITIGDGRFLGLGLMAPVLKIPGVLVFVIEERLSINADYATVSRALRRAVIARSQEILGRGVPMPAYFGGHESDGSPARGEFGSHLTFAIEPRPARLLVLAPHIVERRAPTAKEIQFLDILDRAMEGFHELYAGTAGALTVRRISVDVDNDRLFAPARSWESLTPYQVTHHAKHVGAPEALLRDILTECRRRCFPEPRVNLLAYKGIAGEGLTGSARLTFDVAIRGPVMLGRSRHFGGGLFAGV